MTKRTARAISFTLLISALICGCLYIYSYVSTQAKSAQSVIPISLFTKTLNEHIASDGTIRLSNFQISSVEGGTTTLTFKIEGMFLGTELKSDAEAVGVLNHNALNKHFTFSTNKLYLKDVQIKDGAKKVSITEFSTNKDQFEKKIKVAIERTFENLSVKEMADTYAGWTWLNTVKVNEDHLVVSYSIKESLHTFMIVVGVVILVIIVIAILIACPDCVGLLFLFFD